MTSVLLVAVVFLATFLTWRLRRYALIAVC